VDGLLLRATRSRDIRAPNLIELYTPQTQSLPLPTDPRVGVAAHQQRRVHRWRQSPPAGNSTTQTVGATWQPSFLRRLHLSVDYYNIRIEGRSPRPARRAWSTTASSVAPTLAIPGAR
jgi:outer membrane receptor protein involved in Fe transport